MSDKTRVFSHRHFQLLLGSSSKKKRILFLAFLGIAFLFCSTITFPPGSDASDIQDKLKRTSDRSFDQSQRLNNTEEKKSISAGGIEDRNFQFLHTMSSLWECGLMERARLQLWMRPGIWL